MSSRISNRLPINISTKTRIVPYVSIPVPTERRERKINQSFSMPPSLVKRVAAYAKANGLSASDFVTQLCANFLASIEGSRTQAKLGDQPDTGLLNK
jgi:hypothetical protein